MRNFTLKRTRSRVHPARNYPIYALLGVLACTLVALTVVCVLKTNADRALQGCRDELAANIQINLNETLRALDRMDLPGTNVAEDVLPTMEQHLYAAGELNDVMIAAYGAQSALSAEDFSNVEAALDEVNRMILTGQSTSAAKAELTARMTEMEVAMTTCFGDTDQLKPRTALK